MTMAFRTQNIKTELPHFNKYSTESCKKSAFMLDSIAPSREMTQTTVAEDLIAPGKYSNYNRHPNFCMGRYNLFEIDLRDLKSIRYNKIFPKLVAYYHLFTKLDFSLEKYGSVSISYKDLSERNLSENVNPKYSYNCNNINTLNEEFCETSLININRKLINNKYMPEDIEFLKQLNEQEIETYEVKDLIKPIVLEKEIRAELKNNIQEQIISKFDLNRLYRNIRPLNWLYLPNTGTVKISMFIEDIFLPLSINFNLHPGTKPLVIDDATMITPPEEPTFSSYESSNFGGLMGCLKVRPVNNFSPKRILSNDLKKSKIKLITIRGTTRERFNLLFRLLEMLARNSPPLKAPFKPSLITSETYQEILFDEKTPIKLKTLILYVHSYFIFVIPLLTYFNFATGQTHLCNSYTTIDVKPRVVWHPLKSSYGSSNINFIPPQYRNAGFFSSDQLHFEPEVIFNLLSNYNGFWKIIRGHRENGVNKYSCLEKTFEEDKDNGNSYGQNKEKRDYKVYYVGGKIKMIYKEQEGAIILNLLL
uniref:Uncharacterized protein n=1 Tax=Theileria annulata TaxID=5874 RepID=A0A3B0MIK8_THEAN